MYINFPTNFKFALIKVNDQLNYLIERKLKRFEYYLESISGSPIQTFYSYTINELHKNSGKLMDIDTISYEDALHLLNLRPYQFRSLERTKIVNPQYIKGNVKRFTLIEIKRLHKVLRGVPVRGNFNNVTFKRAISKYRQLGFSFEKAVLWMTQKKLMPFRTTKYIDLEGLVFDEDKLIELLDLL
ncbi:hypothetical protein HQN89_11125 [Paenibacillus frigoriresistens]|nr:hypothetical protein [Paenibacillus frigoriresistens]